MTVEMVLDATPIINFNDRLKRPDLLLKFLDCGYALCTTDEVRKEIFKGRSTAFLEGCIAKRQIKLLITNEINFEQLKSNYPFLGNGELATICASSQVGASDNVCILDDKKAVQVARELGINVRGSIGLLGDLVKRQIISDDEFSSLIENMSAKGFFLKKTDLNPRCKTGI
jgi:predicted nucleic acid-binding protein